ncbi:MAG: hypothetical protein ACRC10_08235 [Thermoguttaceae bacterium]
MFSRDTTYRAFRTAQNTQNVVLRLNDILRSQLRSSFFVLQLPGVSLRYTPGYNNVAAMQLRNDNNDPAQLLRDAILEFLVSKMGEMCMPIIEML